MTLGYSPPLTGSTGTPHVHMGPAELSNGPNPSRLHAPRAEAARFGESGHRPVKTRRVRTWGVPRGWRRSTAEAQAGDWPRGARKWAATNEDASSTPPEPDERQDAVGNVERGEVEHEDLGRRHGQEREPEAAREADAPDEAQRKRTCADEDPRDAERDLRLRRGFGRVGAWHEPCLEDVDDGDRNEIDDDAAAAAPAPRAHARLPPPNGSAGAQRDNDPPSHGEGNGERGQGERLQVEKRHDRAAAIGIDEQAP